MMGLNIFLQNACLATSLGVMVCVSSLVVTNSEAQVTPGALSQVSLTIAGTTPSGGTSSAPSASAGGGIVSFESDATDLVTNDTNLFRDVFYRDPSSNRIVRASVSSKDAQGDYESTQSSVSQVLQNGFFAIAFQSGASTFGSISNVTLIPNIYIRFPTLGITEIASPATGFKLSNGSSFSPSITAIPTKTGQNKVLVAFTATASDLIANDNNSLSDVFLTTITAPTSTNYTPATLGSTVRISNSAFSGQELDGDSFEPKISADGRYVVFTSRSSNLVSPAISNPNQSEQIYRYDIQTGTTILVSKANTGLPGNIASTRPAINYNGRYIAYLTFADNISGRSGLDAPVLMRYDAFRDVTEQVNISLDGQQIGGIIGTSIGLSPSGRLVVFADSSDALVSGDSNGQSDIFVKDMASGRLNLLSGGALGTQSNGTSTNPDLAAKTVNGRSFSAPFSSFSTNLISTTSPSGNGDIFNIDFTVSAPPLDGNSRIETPPDVTLARKTVSFTAQEFSLSTATATKLATLHSANRLDALNRGIRYEFNVSLTKTVGGKRRLLRSTTISKRNRLTVSRSRGTYVVKNRVRIINSKTGKTISRIPFSPTQTLVVK